MSAEPWPEGRFGDETESSGVQLGPRVKLLDGPAIAKPLPELEFLVKEVGLVAGGGAPHLVAGFGYSGKTVALQSLALSLAAGRKAWGAYLCQPRRVVHVDFEQGDTLTRRRYQRLAYAMGVDLPELGDALSLGVFPELALSASHADGWREIMTGRDVLVVDSLRAASGGQDENSSAIREGLDMLGAMSNETGCRPIVIHHARKPTADEEGGRYSIRGSGAIYDGVDGCYLFTASKGEPVKVEHVKARSQGDTADDFALVIGDEASDVNPKEGLSVSLRGAEIVAEGRARAMHDKHAGQMRGDAEALRRLIGSNPGLGVKELRGMTKLSGDRFAAALAILGPAVDVRESGNAPYVKRQHYLKGSL